MIGRYISRLYVFTTTITVILLLTACDSNSLGDQANSATELPLTKASVTVDGVERNFFLYLPSNYWSLYESDARQIPVVFSFHDFGQSGEINANTTGWHELAEEKGFVAAFPNAVGDTWNTTLTPSGPDELAFVQAIWEYIRSEFSLSSGNPVYLTGIGTGGSVAHQIAMTGASLSKIQVISSVASIRGTADQEVFNLPAVAEPGEASLPSTSMAVWIFTDNAELNAAETRQALYWQGATMNDVGPGGTTTSDNYFNTLSYKNPTNSFHEVRISSFKSPELSGKALSRVIWNDMFSTVLRFLDDTRVNGSLHPWETIAEMKLIESSKEFSDAAGGTHRWLTYVPSNYDALTGDGMKLPLVFSLHGRRGSARWQAILTQWHKVAEDRGFIVVYPQGPSATWDASIGVEPQTSNPDVQYFLELLAEVNSRYAIDTTRVFLTGTSMGALFTNRVAVQYPELFAGIAPCYSGHLRSTIYENYASYPDIRVDVPIPVWQCRGGEEPDNAYPGGLLGQEAARQFWRVVVNGYPEDPGNVEDESAPTEIQIDGTKVTRIFNDERGLAEYRWQVTNYVPHFWPPNDQAAKMWDEMLSRYRRVGTQLVEIP